MSEFLEESEEKELRDILHNFIDRRCIFRCNPDKIYQYDCPKGTIASSSPGVYSNWQFYLRNLTQNTDMVTSSVLLIINEMFKNNTIKENFQLTGLETSSIPLISTLQSKLRDVVPSVFANSFIIRKERKNYGLFNFIDGIPNPNTPVMIIDDVINTCSSLNRVLDTCLFELDLDPFHQAHFIVNFNKDKQIIYFNGVHIKINSIFTLDDFDLKYNSEKYWFPFDCDKSFNKRPDYI